MIRILTVVAGVVLGSLCAGAGAGGAEPLPATDNVELVKIIGESTVLARRSPLDDTRLPLAITLVRIHADGECDGTPESCPTQTVYIALSSFDEYPERKPYQLPAAHGWEFKDWTKLPESEAADAYFEFTVTKQVVAADISKDWWSYETYTVKANLHDASLERVP